MRAWVGILFALSMITGAACGYPSGGGGSAIYPVMSLWAQDYAQKTGARVNYQPIGSGGGIRQSLSRTIDFGNTDMPLSAADLKRGKLMQFPIAFIAIVPIVNIPGVAPGALVLDGPTLANIFLGNIKRWNEPAIARLNPALKLPDLPIIIVHRADASGTTFHFTSYLAATSTAWRTAVGSGTAVAWPVGSAGKGNAGVVAVLQQTRGGIGYVEYAYALQSKLTFASLINRAGLRVQPDLRSFQAAAAQADFRRDAIIPANPPGQASWPLTAATYMLIHEDGPQDLNRQIIQFLDYALRQGRARAEQLHYVPMPESVVKEVEALWATRLGVRP